MEQVVNRIDAPFSIDMNLPGSKSITLRDLSLAALGNGTSVIRFPGVCDDSARMVDSLRKLGIKVDTTSEDAWVVEGRGGLFDKGTIEINVGQSAASTRLLMGLVALRPGTTVIDGHESMRARPNKYLLDAIATLGATVESTNDGYLPATITGSTSLKEAITMKGDKSSQYFSALMQIAAMLPRGLRIDVDGELVSKPYIDITMDELRKFGVQVENRAYRTLIVPAQVIRATDMVVEGDASAASYFCALATLHGGRVTIQNLGRRTQQGDYQFFALMERLGSRVEMADGFTTVTGPENGRMNPLDGDVDMELMPDVAMTLMAMAPFIPGSTRITGLSTLRIKECDRIAAPVAEMKKFGIQAVEGADWVEIPYCGDSRPWDSERTDCEISVETYHDHRIAMSFAVLASKIGGVKISNPRCVDKTYPNFWRDLARLNQS